MKLKAFANYGVLAHEKKVLFTADLPSGKATYSEEVEIMLPEGFDISENASGEQLITVPDGIIYLANEILNGYEESPALSWYDAEGKLHHKKCTLV